MIDYDELHNPVGPKYQFAGIELQGSTDKAFHVNDGIDDYWLPRSCTTHDGRGNWTIPESLARTKGMID